MFPMLFALALLVGFLIGIGFIVVLIASVSIEFFHWLDRWQTLIGGFLALVAATATAAVVVWQTRVSARSVQKQLNAAKKEKNKEIRRKQNASRAAMPVDLSEICQYAMKCSQHISGAITNIRNNTQKPLDMVEFPFRAVDNLKQLIEHLDSAEARIVADLLASAQYSVARFNSFLIKCNSLKACEADADSSVVALVQMRLRADYMFDFARRESNIIRQPKFCATDIANCLMVLRIDEVISRRCRAEIEEELERVICDDDCHGCDCPSSPYTV